MGRFVIFCAAGFDGLLEPVAEDDFLLAADGGLRHLKSLGITPDEILGDFDSLGYVPEHSLRFPAEKDDTDSMLAIRRGLELGYREFWLYGSLDGPRLDHTVANYQALQYLADHHAFGYLIGKDYLVTVVKDGSLLFPAGCRGTVSVFCSGSDARGVSLKGLYYPLENAVLTSGFPLGVSNHFTGQASEIRVAQGSLLVFFPRAAGLPQRRDANADL